ncbi:DEAD/DEAH box helicase, partial [Candidatus Peregrinibacteria bacterium]|nr:DEAD/DEAH box helicase [Candidatus Peregrinibacteria bacterium]
RKSAKGYKFKGDDKDQSKFEANFPYDETPGQLQAMADVKADMERTQPMDRLVCGDVGFGKTEVAMRAAFKAVKSGKQVALVSPITILADQHYKSFVKRMEGFDIRVDMLSRFKSAAEQKKIVEKLAKGEVDVIVGTHRLLQKDIKFKNLGLVVVDEEQRFGVKQKEALKELKTEVDFLTLTATPIPRTLNIALNKLRDISTITTPPPGRLPVITEVRRFSQGLIREAILKELERGGQVYFLHNRVQTIDGLAEKLRKLIPEASFGVAHGKLGAGDLEERIMAFKEHQFDVLVSSTIIENGIDLSNANTLIVNNAEKFGLAQLYQLRGRVGRGKKQAYAYFLYHGQRLKLDAKKRLKAIVEASELGSGFQIAMKDLEIRGAGDILGAKQHGVINVVGVSHFIRMLNKAVEDLKAGRVMREEEPEDVSVELPVTAYIPDKYINNVKEKISVYQRLSGADNFEYLNEIKEDLIDEYGSIPVEVSSLFNVIELKILAKMAGVVGIKAESVYMTKDKEIILHLSDQVKPENIMSLLEYNPKWMIAGNKLKIKHKDLGFQWEEALKTNLKKLAKQFVRK